MKFLDPGARLQSRWMNELKLSVLSMVYLVTFGVALAAGMPLLPPVAWLLVRLILALVLYLVVYLHLQPRPGFAVFNAMTERISEGDLTVQVDASIGGRMKQSLQALAQNSSNLGHGSSPGNTLT